MNNTQIAREKKFIGIEFLRFLCSFSVIIYHYKTFFGGSSNEEFYVKMEHQPFFSFLHAFYMDGGFAVRIFWAISGFIFIWKYSNSIFSKKTSAWKFFIFRFSRLYPLHIATLIFITILQFIYKESHGTYFFDPKISVNNFLANVFFISYNLSFNGVIWSVCIEAIIYFVFFILARRMKFSLLSTCLLTVIFKGLLSLTQINMLVLTAQCGSLFFLGGSLYYLYMQIESLGRKKKMLITLAIFPLILALAHFGFGFGDPSLRGIRSALKIYLFIPLLILVFILFFERDSSILKKASHIGNYTYSSYLIHPVISIIFVLISDHLGFSREFYYGNTPFITYLLCVFIASHFIYEYFEIYSQAIIRKHFAIKEPRHSKIILKT